jgi:hypothetical protein
MKLCNLIVQGETYPLGDAKGCGLDISQLEEDGGEDDDPSESMAFCVGVFPIHNVEKRDALEQLWMPLDWPSKIPVNEIKEYFGEEIGFYFAFLGHYVSGLLPIVPVAVVVWVLSVLEMTALTHDAMYASAGFSIVMTCGYSVILDSWKCKQSSLAHEWSAFGAERSLPPRPGFKGQIVHNAVQGRLEVDFPQEERGNRMRRTLAASGAMIFLLLVTTTLIFTWKAVLSNDPNTNPYLLLLPSVLNAIQITVYAVVYKIVADWLTDFENHKTILDHNAALFRKLTLFYFLSNFSAPLYIAFMKSTVEDGGCSDPLTGETTWAEGSVPGDLLRETSSNRACGLELGTNVLILFLGNDFAGRLANSVIFPRIARFLAEYVEARDAGSLGEGINTPSCVQLTAAGHVNTSIL